MSIGKKCENGDLCSGQKDSGHTWDCPDRISSLESKLSIATKALEEITEECDCDKPCFCSSSNFTVASRALDEIKKGEG